MDNPYEKLKEKTRGQKVIYKLDHQADDLRIHIVFRSS